MHRNHILDPCEDFCESPIAIDEELGDGEDHHVGSHQLRVFLRRLDQAVHHVVMLRRRVLPLLDQTLSQLSEEFIPSWVEKTDLEPAHQVGEHIHDHKPPQDDHAAAVLHEVVFFVLEAVDIHPKGDAGNCCHGKLVGQGVEVNFFAFAD